MGGEASAPVAPKRPSVALALGGGAARGFAHIGVLRALVANGITPDIIAGTSIGAVAGGCFAGGCSTHWSNGHARSRVRGVLGYLDVSLSGSGLIGGKRLAGNLDSALAKTHRRSPDPLRRDRHRGPHRPRNLADPWQAGGGTARVLCPARHLSAGAHRRPLAGGRRAGQSGAGFRRARARRPRRHRRQSQRRPVRARHRPSSATALTTATTCRWSEPKAADAHRRLLQRGTLVARASSWRCRHARAFQR